MRKNIQVQQSPVSTNDSDTENDWNWSTEDKGGNHENHNDRQNEQTEKTFFEHTNDQFSLAKQKQYKNSLPAVEVNVLSSMAAAVTKEKQPTSSVMETTTLSTPNSSNRIAVSKRSFSESSADELSRVNDKASENGGGRKKMWQNELHLNSSSSSAQPIIRRHNGDQRDKRSSNRHKGLSDAADILVRIAMAIAFIKLETMQSFKRIIHMEELWLYRNPRTPDIVSPASLVIITIFAPFLTTLTHLLWSRDYRNFRAASWAWTLGVCLNGVTTSMLKVTVGRPRPDFFYRCFPDGVMVFDNVTIRSGELNIWNCTGNPRDINEGFKSFPSGHSSFAFAAGGFIAIYLAGKLCTFVAKGRGQTWRLLITIAPLVWASWVAISRTCDYHHHWQDVLIGGLLGLSIAYFTYRQYYPSIFANNCAHPLKGGGDFLKSDIQRGGLKYMPLPCEDQAVNDVESTVDSETYDSNSVDAQVDRARLLGNHKEDKWF